MSARLARVVLMVRRFDIVRRFYEGAFGLTAEREYRGEEHPSWVLFEPGGVELVIHADEEANPNRLAVLTFTVDDLATTVQQIQRYGGKVRKFVGETDMRPIEPLRALEANCEDPEGNGFLVWQIL